MTPEKRREIELGIFEKDLLVQKLDKILDPADVDFTVSGQAISGFTPITSPLFPNITGQELRSKLVADFSVKWSLGYNEVRSSFL